MCNLFFSLEELHRAIGKGRKTAPGKDGISYEIVKNLSDLVLEEILSLINYIWQEGILPISWKFADDGAIWKRGRNIKQITERMQVALNKVTCWGEKWGFKISVDKSKYIIFGNKKTECGGLFLYEQAIERVKEFKFLGVHFDEKLTWRKQINNVVNKCEKVIIVMRSL